MYIKNNDMYIYIQTFGASSRYFPLPYNNMSNTLTVPTSILHRSLGKPVVQKGRVRAHAAVCRMCCLDVTSVAVIEESFQPGDSNHYRGILPSDIGIIINH